MMKKTKSESVLAEERKANEFKIDAKFHTRNDYGNPAFIVSPSNGESLNTARKIRDNLRERFNEMYNPVWIPTTDDDEIRYAKLTFANRTAKNADVQVKEGCTYRLTFNVVIRTSAKGKKYISLVLNKNPKLIAECPAQTADEILSF